MTGFSAREVVAVERAVHAAECEHDWEECAGLLRHRAAAEGALKGLEEARGGPVPVMYSLRLPAGLLTRVRDEARESGMSSAAVVRAALAAWLGGER